MSNVQVLCTDVALTNRVAISSSSVVFIFKGPNEFLQIVCTENSNVSLAVIDIGFAAVSASGQDGAGIGIPVNGWCFSFVLYNGSVSISVLVSVSVEGHSASEAIGTRRARTGTSWLGSLTISGWNITAVCSGTDAYQSVIGPAGRGAVNYHHGSFVFVTVIAILYFLFYSDRKQFGRLFLDESRSLPPWECERSRRCRLLTPFAFL
jgi:hypothetical protein